MIGCELGVFLVVGFLAVLIDFLSYQSLVWSQLFGVDVAKGVGFITGTVLAFFGNWFWTFGHKRLAAGSAWRFALLYVVTLSTNVVINSLALSTLITLPGTEQLAFLIATAVSVTMNFVGMKSFVFKAASPLKLT